MRKPTVSHLMARAMLCTWAGWNIPWRMGPGASGALFVRLMQAQIAEKLDDPDRLARYVAMRDAVRDAVKLTNEEGPVAAGPAFEACAARLPAFEDDPELHDLAHSWLDQAWAYHDARRKDHAAAEARLRNTMDIDTRLEQVHGYDLMHAGRINTVHLWLRVQAAVGARDTALRAIDAILAYVNGFGDDLPLGDGWSREAAARIPADVAAAMTCRITSEAGAILGGLDQDESARALSRLPALERLSPDVHQEILDWVRLERAWAEGRTDDFLAGAIPYLVAGRRETWLWYATLLDLCRTARALRPGPGSVFCENIAEFAGNDPVLPGRMRADFRKLTETPSAPWVATVPARRFHLVCMGLPRSGVVSLAALFGNCRTAGEYAEAETIKVLTRHRRGDLDDDALRTYMARRDRESTLEMDAASFLYLASDTLLAFGDDTRFVLPVRAPAAWFESFMRELLRWHGQLRARDKAPPAWVQEYAEALFGRFEWEEITTPEARRAFLPDVARRCLTHWTRTTGKMLDDLPPERTLVLRTQDLGPMRARLAAFAGLSEDALTSQSHENASPPGPSPVAELPEGWLAETAAELCGATHARALERCASPA